MAGSVIWALFFSSSGNNSKLTNLAGDIVAVNGEIVSEPDVREFNTKLIVSGDFLELDRSKIYIDEKILITVPTYPEFKTGQEIKIIGKIKLPENFQNDNGIEFDYINFLAKDRIYTTMYYPKIELIYDPPFNFYRSIFQIKQKFLEQTQKIIPSPESELLGGILLGVKRSLGKDLEENFRRVGLIHIIVLSGYNITIIATAIFKFFSFLPKIFATTLGVISILIFAVMVGSGATVIRATIMTLLALAVQITGRNYDVNRALFLAGAIMIIQNPMILLYDPSFQLSFLATFGLINCSDFVKRFLKFVPEKFALREIGTATLATQITVLPLLIKMTGELSVIAPIVNVITLQIIPLTMLTGTIAGLISFISEPIGILVGFVPYVLLKYILFIVNLFAGLSFATVRI